MKIATFVLTKILLILTTGIVLTSVAMDIRILVGELVDRKNLSNYITFENENTCEDNQVLIQMIQTTLAFRSSTWAKYFQAFENLESKSLAALEDDLILLFNHDGSTLDDLWYRGDDIKLARKRLTECTNQEVKPLYESLFYEPLLELLYNQVSQYPCIMYFPSPELVRPVTEDSTYIAWFPYGEERQKYAFRINDHYFHHDHQEYCTIPVDDTLRIETLMISNKTTYIDTVITTQILAKVEGRWWNVGE